MGPIVDAALVGCVEGSEIPRMHRMHAKTYSDHTRSNTSNKPYRANWAERVEDVVQTIATELDRIRSVGELTRYFSATRDAPHPRYLGI